MRMHPKMFRKPFVWFLTGQSHPQSVVIGETTTGGCLVVKAILILPIEPINRVFQYLSILVYVFSIFLVHAETISSKYTINNTTVRMTLKLLYEVLLEKLHFGTMVAPIIMGSSSPVSHGRVAWSR